MDTLTHALSAALLARATAPRVPAPGALSTGGRVGVGFLAGAFPDADAVARLFTDSLSFLNLHRGVTHSVILMPAWAWVLALVFAGLSRGRLGWRAFFGVCLAAIAIHIAGDVITVYGTQVFAPFSDFKAALPTTFIIDPYFTGIIVVGLVVSWGWGKSRVPAVVGMAALAGYVGFQGLLHQQAWRMGAEYARNQGLHGVRVHALPQPLSPFNWKIVIAHGDAYDVANVSLLRGAPLPPPGKGAGFFARIAAVYRPPADLRWQHYSRFGRDPAAEGLVRQAWTDAAFAGYRRFAEYPALYRVDRERAGTCVWFNDLRFAIGDLRAPFRFGLCRKNGSSPWALRRLKDGANDAVM